MARNFVRASSMYARVAATPVTAVPLSMSMWFYAAGTGTTYDSFFIGGNADYFGIYLNFVAASVTAVTGHSGEARATTSTTFSASTWNQAGAVFAANNDRRAYLNGGGKGTNATSLTPSGINNVGVGAYYNNSSAFGHMDGRLANAAIWNVALTDDEMAALGRGVSPLRVQPQNLVAYWPLFGNGSPEPNLARNSTDYSLTLINGPTQIDHAPVQSPAGITAGWRGAFQAAAPAPQPSSQTPIEIAIPPRARTVAVAARDRTAMIAARPRTAWPIER